MQQRPAQVVPVHSRPPPLAAILEATSRTLPNIAAEARSTA